MKILKRRWWLAAAAAVLVAVSAVLTTVGSGGANAAPARATAAKAGGLGQSAGLLPRNKLTEESALQVNLSNETVRLPLYPGIAAHLRACGPCGEDFEGLLAAVRGEAD